MKWCKFCEQSTRSAGKPYMCKICWRRAHVNKRG